MTEVTSSELRALMAHVPSVERVIESALFRPLLLEFGRTQVVDGLRRALAGWREAAGSAVWSSTAFSSPLA